MSLYSYPEKRAISLVLLAELEYGRSEVLKSLPAVSSNRKLSEVYHGIYLPEVSSFP